MAAVRTGWWTRNTLPWVDHSIVITPPPASGTATALAPVLIETVAPPAASAVASSLPPTITVGYIIQPPAAAATAMALAPAIRFAVSVPAANAAATALAPTIQMTAPGVPYTVPFTV